MNLNIFVSLIMERIIIYILIPAALIFALAGCNLKDNSGTEGPGQNEIWIWNNTIETLNDTVEEGTTITWVNKDNIAHTTTSDDGLWSSGRLSQGESFSYTFSNAGTFKYKCMIHDDVMTGEIVVQSSSGKGIYAMSD